MGTSRLASPLRCLKRACSRDLGDAGPPSNRQRVGQSRTQAVTDARELENTKAINFTSLNFLF